MMLSKLIILLEDIIIIKYFISFLLSELIQIQQVKSWSINSSQVVPFIVYLFELLIICNDHSCMQHDREFFLQFFHNVTWGNHITIQRNASSYSTSFLGEGLARMSLYSHLGYFWPSSRSHGKHPESTIESSSSTPCWPCREQQASIWHLQVFLDGSRVW